MNLFLDDARVPNDCANYTGNSIYRLKQWKIVRNYFEFIEAVTKELPKIISFDHDLAEEHYEDLFSNENWNKPDSKIILKYDSYKEKSGYECCKWLTDYCRSNNLKLPEIYVHSMNPVGKKNIIELVNGFEKKNLVS